MLGEGEGRERKGEGQGIGKGKVSGEKKARGGGGDGERRQRESGVVRGVCAGALPVTTLASLPKLMPDTVITPPPVGSSEVTPMTVGDSYRSGQGWTRKHNPKKEREGGGGTT